MVSAGYAPLPAAYNAALVFSLPFGDAIIVPVHNACYHVATRPTFVYRCGLRDICIFLR